MSRWTAAVGTVGVVLAMSLHLGGCTALKERIFGSCPYDVEICEAACEDGVVGRGGCLDAGERLHAMVQSKDPNVTMDRALHYLERACAGGMIEGCRQQYDLRAPPPQQIGHIVMSRWSEAQPRLAEIYVEPAALAARIPALREGCQKGPPTICALLGQALIGQDEPGARDAFQRACAGPDAPAVCPDVLAAVARAERFRQNCDQADPRACHCLGRAIWKHDPYRSIPLWKRECVERYGRLDERWLQRMLLEVVHDDPPPGFSVWSQPIEAFDNLWDPCRPGVDEPVSEEEVKTFDQVASLEWGTPTVQGVPAEATIQLIQSRASPIKRCFTRGMKTNPHLEGRVLLKFQIDRHGYAVRRDHEASRLPDLRVVLCALDEMRKIRFARPNEGLGSVSYPIAFVNKRER